MGCNKTTKLRVWRHHSIRDRMEESIKSMDPHCDIGSDIAVGHRMTPDGPVEVITNGPVEVGPDSYIIDFFVTNPSSKLLNINGLWAYEVTNGAALQAEKLKRQHYATVYPLIHPRRVIPFAIKATGRLGPSALAFLFKICGTHSFRCSKF
jgi:hypothetical protein